MSVEEKRLNIKSFRKKCKVTKRFREVLFPILKKNKFKALSEDELMHLHVESLLELTIGVVNKNIKVICVKKKDFDDGSDAKSACSQFRNNNIKKGHWRHTVFITGHEKESHLRCMVYDDINDKFYYFVIPQEAIANSIEIVFETYSNRYTEPTWGEPRRFKQRGQGLKKWWNWEVESFEEMACIINPISK
jgi:hypothetical protein|tara:strand:- start:857 stop:1429 length:573 start_codon:yes stop_codon:yes gene_type:complete